MKHNIVGKMENKHACKKGWKWQASDYNLTYILGCIAFKCYV